MIASITQHTGMPTRPTTTTVRLARSGPSTSADDWSAASASWLLRWWSPAWSSLRNSFSSPRCAERSPVPRVSRTSLPALLLALALMFVSGATFGDVALACTCAMQQLADFTGEYGVVFAGTVVKDDDNGVTVAVEHWFSGTGAASEVLISGNFGGDNSCGVDIRPAVGSRWIMAAWRPPFKVKPALFENTVNVGLCAPFANLSTPEGAALLEEAKAIFGDGVPLPSATGRARAAGLLVFALAFMALALIRISRQRRTSD